MVETRSASTALNKHKGLQQFLKWLLVDEQAVDRNPMDRVRQPKTPTKLVPVMRADDTAKLLDECKGGGDQVPRRDRVRHRQRRYARLRWPPLPVRYPRVRRTVRHV
jgi:site-specific recombinase XerC